MERIRFRRLTVGDGELMLRLHGDPDTNTFNPYGATPDLVAAEDLLHRWLAHVERYGFGYEIAMLGDEAVGICGARHDEWGGRDILNLYWRLLPEYQGRGLAHELAVHALVIARAAGGAEIVARMLPGNPASAHVAERLGLVRAPELDGEHDGVEWIVYALRQSN